jgi:hypothetical protein
MARTSGPNAWGRVLEIAFTGNKLIKAGRPRVIVYSTTPNGAVTSKKGTLCWDAANNRAYINTNGATAWTRIDA